MAGLEDDTEELKKGMPVSLITDENGVVQSSQQNASMVKQIVMNQSGLRSHRDPVRSYRNP